VLDMQVGVDYSEDMRTRRHISGITRVPAAFARAGRTIRGRELLEYLLTLRKSGEHGRVFDYKTVNTEVLCWVMKRATGVPLATC